VLVGYDGTPASRDALRWAIVSAGGWGRVVVGYAMESTSSNGLPSGDDATDLEEHVLGVLSKMAPRLGGRPECQFVRLVGEPARALAKVATGDGATEVVVGSPDLDRFHSCSGSIFQGLLRRVRQPLVLVPPGSVAAGSPVPRAVLVVALAGGSVSDQAAQAVARLAHDTGANVVAAGVAHRVGAGLTAIGVDVDRERARLAAERAVGQLAAFGVAATGEAWVGDGPRVVKDLVHVHGAGLVAVDELASTWSMWSLALALLRAACVPVLIPRQYR
jgi:hypothetical protein